jgi:hypothetical protein
MGATANPNRRADITAALKRVKPSDMLSLEDLANIYGTTKGPFVTAKKRMPGFPPATLAGTSHIYPAQKALRAMLDFETRHDAAAETRAEKTAQMLGGIQRRRDKEAVNASIPVRDLMVINRMAAEIEERERTQREYIPASEVAFVAGEVFSELSEFMAGLSNKIDPNGLLDPGLRKLVDDAGAEKLLGFHRKMKNILNADANAGSPREAPARARQPRARRKRT